MFFGRVLFDIAIWQQAILGFVTFCVASSAVYMINDIMDAEKDRLHPTKKDRPIASGEVSLRSAWICTFLCLCVTGLLSFLLIYMGDGRGSLHALILLVVYIWLNILYSKGLKRIPVLDVVILASGYVIRVYYGGFITGVEVSDWLFLVIMTGALYMGFGKRRGELLRGSETREVLTRYTNDFLDSAMMLSMGLTIMFYALWAKEIQGRRMVFTVPFFIVIMLRYNMVSDKKADGDPIEVIFSDAVLLVLLVIFGIGVSLLLYF